MGSLMDPASLKPFLCVLGTFIIDIILFGINHVSLSSKATGEDGQQTSQKDGEISFVWMKGLPFIFATQIHRELLANIKKSTMT